MFKSKSQESMQNAINIWLQSQEGRITVYLPSFAVCGVSETATEPKRIVAEYHIAIWYEKKT